MSRLEKISIFTIAVMVSSVFLVGWLVYVTGDPMRAIAGVALMVLMAFGHRFFKPGEGEPDWDEREIEVSRKARAWGFTIFWVVLALSATQYPVHAGYMKPIPAYALTYIIYLGAYVLAVGGSMAAIYLMSTSAATLSRKVAFWLVAAALLLPPAGLGALLVTHVPEAAGVAGTERVTWHVTANDRVRAESIIELHRWPAMPCEIDLTLPFEDAQIESATYSGLYDDYEENEAGEKLLVQQTRNDEELTCIAKGGGVYSLELPGEYFSAFDRRLKIVWSVPLSSVEVIDGDYRARVEALIPVSSYALKVELDPGCQYQLGDPTIRNTYQFGLVSGDGQYRAKYGTCTMGIRPKS